VAVGDELREARLQAGLTQGQVGAAVGLSASEISRIELGQAARVSYETLVLVAAVLGLDLPLRAFPAGDPVRDIAQLTLLAKLRGRLPDGLRWRTEVPLRIPGDRRAWDAVIEGRGWRLPVEAESRLRDVQACSRKVMLKRRDDRGEVTSCGLPGRISPRNSLGPGRQRSTRWSRASLRPGVGSCSCD
jgi:transcriptional regulator with XRE-family HTH domain